ncbi:MAG: acyltransferase [Oscillospiraceae bacterium]|jgi:surface polysaccharide O-acyltransferase-like enzyme|nr:acyltransferase [Oscillospiraceae bacterium]
MNKQNGDTARYSSIDALRFFAAFFVVSIHATFKGSFGEYFRAISNVAVPLFFIISGYFTFNSDSDILRQRSIKQIKRVAKITVFAVVVHLIVNTASQLPQGHFTTYISSIFSFRVLAILTVFNELPLEWHLWYLFAYMYTMIMYAIFSKRITKAKTKTLLLFIFALLAVDAVFGKYAVIVLGRTIPLLCTRNFMFTGLPYFTLGFFIRRASLTPPPPGYHRQVRSPSNAKLSLCVILFSSTSVLEKYCLSTAGVEGSGDYYISTTLLALSIFLLCAQNPDFAKDTLLERLGREHSLNIYIWHVLIARYVEQFVLHITATAPAFSVLTYILPIIVFAITLLLSVIYKSIAARVNARRQNNS